MRTKGTHPFESVVEFDVKTSQVKEFALTFRPRGLAGCQADLLGAKRMDQRSWQVNTAGVPIKILPFTDIGEEQYSTYIHVT